MKIYKYIYYYFFLQSSKKNAVPEIPVYAMLSLVQTSNLITLINIFLIITRINVYYDILKFGLFGPITFYIINYYYFSKRGNGAIIIKDDSYSLGKYFFLLDVYNLASYFLVAITYFLYKEF
jgi:hypothetical protein